MSKITKILALMLAVLFTLSLVACGGDDQGEVNETTVATTQEQPDASNDVTVAPGETTTTTTAATDKNGKTKKQKTTTTADSEKATEKAAKTSKTTKNSKLVDARKGISTTGALIERTTNKAGNASAKFIKSLKGFTLKILYPWENIYGDKKCQVAAEESIKEIQNMYGVKIEEEGQFNKYNENLASELAAKNCDNHIYYAQGNYFPSYFQKGYIADLTPAMREAAVDFNDPWYISDAKGFLNIDGKQYGWVAYEDEYTMPSVIIYNKKLLNQKRLADPAKLASQGKWTWDVLEKYAKKFSNDKSVTGFVGSGVILLEAIANQYGASLTNVSRGAEPTTNIGDSKVKSALTTLGEWTVGKNAWCETFSDKSWSYGKTQLAEGKVAMYYGNHDTIQNFKGTSTQKDIGIAPFPTKKGSKTYTGISDPQFIAFIPIVHQDLASKILFVRNEYYRYNYRFVQRNFQYKWETYFGTNTEAITNAANIKFARNGNKVKFCWTNICETGDGVSTASVINDVTSGKSTAAQAISSKKTALQKSYSDVWSGHKITGNV